MNFSKILSPVAFILAVCFCLSQSARAGGISLYEISTPDVGLASAGYAAAAQDASTLFKNPAGMSRLEGGQLNSSLQVLYGNAQFSGNSKTTTTGGDGDNAVGALPGASLFITYPVTEKLTVGFGTFSYFGLALDYGNNWAGRYYVQNATLLGLTLMPAASFKVNDWLAIGGGLNAMYGYLDTEIAVNNVIGSDGKMKLKDHVWGFGGNAGVMIQPREGTRIGVNYLSQVDLNFNAKPGFNNLGPGLGALLANPPTLDLGVTVPQSVMVGVYQDLNEKWAVMADVGWQNWSKFGEVAVGVNNGSPSGPKDFTTQLHYDDTWHGAAGVQYQYSEAWRFTGGLAYDTSAVSDKNRSVILPMAAAYRFGLGTFWKMTKSVDLGAAYELAWSGNVPVTQGAPADYRGEVSGSYNNLCFSFVSLNLNWRF
ncbi:MAG: outer membrane protein transport protein [Verrucomicrobiales bacterium]|nr:outer membrane protein transport protein [Verrucomicrobiales bacterium]